MYIETLSKPSGEKALKWEVFLSQAGLEADKNVTQTVLIFDDDEIIATGSRQENILKCIAVSPLRQGEDLTSKIITELRKGAFEEGFSHLFIYTKPENEHIFSSLFFYPVAKTNKVLLMESRQGAVTSFVNSLKKEDTENTGA